MSKKVCKICGRVLSDYENKICDDCFERQNEKFEDKEQTRTDEIFGSEEAYWRYKVGNDR